MEKAGELQIKAFINIGGSWPNIGENSEILKLKPGLTKIHQIPDAEGRGVIYEMALQEIPVIHLLFIRGLIQRYRLPWDPIPLPKPGEGEIYQLVGAKQKSFLLLGMGYFVVIFLFFIFRKKLLLERYS
jgi:hypothetical protein